MIDKKYIKTILLVLLSFVVIAFSLVMPKLFLKIEDLSREKEIFARAKKESKIDVQAEKIYLVRFIHDIYDLKEKVYYDNNKKVSVTRTPMIESTGNTEPGEQIKNEISKIIGCNILKDIDFVNLEDYYEVENVFDLEYSVMTIELVNKDFGIGIGMEEKTGKIISLDFPKRILESEVAKSKQLENYIKYLDLDIIGDWRYEDQVLKSEKAQLVAMLEEKNEVCMLTIAPIETYEEYSESNYEVVEKKK